MAYFWFKTFHIIGVVVWFVGLFYLLRLFRHHLEANEQSEPARTILKTNYQQLEQSLYKFYMLPGMIMTITMATGMVIIEPEVLKNSWLQIKLGLVTLLVIYHFFCGYFIKQLAEEKCTWSSQQLRALHLHMVPSTLLLGIVLLAVFKIDLPMLMLQQLESFKLLLFK